MTTRFPSSARKGIGLSSHRRLTCTALLGALFLGATLAAPLAGAQAVDSDGDGLYDEDEISVYLTNPSLFDTDGDGVGDGEEIYFGTNPLAANTAPDQADTDGDGLYDLDETSLYGTDPNRFDTDGDGAGDGDEVYNGTDPLAGAAPADQAPPPDPAPATGNDGFTPDTAVIIPGEVTGADVLDADNDGLTSEEEGRLGTDPNLKDSDGDGLSDGAEIKVHGTNPLDRDSDHDGIVDSEDPVLGQGQGQGQPGGETEALPGDPAAPAQNEPDEPADPIGGPVSADEREDALQEGDACRIEGACGNDGPPMKPHCWLDDLQDPTRISSSCE